MASPIDASGLDRLLSQTMSALEQFTGGPDGAEPPEGDGQAADGMITVRVAPPGRISALTFDPRVMRMASETLAEEVTAAVNEALADLQTKATAAVAGQVPLGALGTKLRSIQEDARRQFATVTESLVAAQERIVRQGGG